MTFGKGCHLHLIDGSAYIFRAYHALPPLTRKSDGLPVGAVAGFCNMVYKMVEESKGPDAPTHGTEHTIACAKAAGLTVVERVFAREAGR